MATCALWFRSIAVLAILGVAPFYVAGQQTLVPGEATFEADIQPLLTRYGCNSGPCHGKSRGQNGFALSLFGFDSDFDHDAIVKSERGRRITPSSAENSLLLLKATAALPHGGGARFDVGSEPFRLLVEWISAGGPRTSPQAPQLEHVVIEPSALRMSPEERVSLHVIAKYSDGSSRDVTAASAFQSNEQAIAAVNPRGIVLGGPVPGETAVMARYMNHIAVCGVSIPLAGEVPDSSYVMLPRHHPLNSLVWDKLQRLGMLPSETTTDATFHRRAFLRAIGRLPQPEETRSFLKDPSPDKRTKLVDALLERPEYADFWANKWADLLRPNPYRVGMKGVWMLDAWIRDSFRHNKPYDQFVRELLTAQGSTWQNGATVIYRDRPTTVELASSVSQLFLGVRLECAKCHHHPFEVWSQDDFYGFSAFFARVGHHGGLSPPISGGEELIFTARSGSLEHGRTGEIVPPKPLTGSPANIADGQDPREVLMDWMVAPDNLMMARVMANRVWAELMGMGIVEPVDDMRATNPASNSQLLEFLTHEFRDHGYDVKQLIRTIMTSDVFGLSSHPNERNLPDLKYYSRYYRQRLRAETLLDAINDVLGIEEEFAAMPRGSRAVQLWTYRSQSVFLDTFGRPDPNQDPPCERTSDSTTPQLLHLMNSPELNRKIADDQARPAKLAQSPLSNEELVEEIYLRVYCRLPTDDERNQALALLPPSEKQVERRSAIEDLFWALMNTPEFYFVD